MTIPKLNTTNFEKLNRKILENFNNMRAMQDELQSTVDSLEKSDMDYRKGRLPRNSFRRNFTRYSKEKRRLEKDINRNVRDSLLLISQAKKITREQRF